jgi:hypothetical protein
METVDCLVTGRVRNSQVFEAAMSPLLVLRSQGMFRRIVLSVWNDDVAENPGLMDSLVSQGVVLIQNGGPLPVRSVGNYWEQVKTLEGGLGDIEDGVHVFKTRTDMLYFGGATTIADIVQRNVGIPSGQHGFQYKIWIPSFVAFWPFFMADQCYLGAAKDLRHFLRFDADVEAKGIPIALYPGSTTHPSAASAEIRFWLQPFLDRFPLLREYSSIWPHAMNGHAIYPDIQLHLWQNPLYQEYLAVYWKLIADLFRVSEGKFGIVQQIDEQGRAVVRARAHENNSTAFVSDILQLRTPYPVSFSTDAGLRALVQEGTDQAHAALFRDAWQRIGCYEKTPQRMQHHRQLHDQILKMANAYAR